MSGKKNSKTLKLYIFKNIYVAHKLVEIDIFLIHGSNNGTLFISIVIPYFCLFSS
jgi:hypothetical protein